MAKRKPKPVVDESAQFIERSEMDHLAAVGIFGPPVTPDAPWLDKDTPEG